VNCGDNPDIPAPSAYQDRSRFPSNRADGPVRGKAVPPCARAPKEIAAPSRRGRPQTPTVRPRVGHRGQQPGACRPRGIKRGSARKAAAAPPADGTPLPSGPDRDEGR